MLQRNCTVQPKTAHWIEKTQETLAAAEIVLENSVFQRPSDSNTPWVLTIGLGWAEQLAALAQWSCQSKTPLRLLVLEDQPLGVEQIQTLAEDLASPWSDYLNDLASHWPIVAPGLHRMKLSTAPLEVFFYFGSIATGLDQARGGVNAFFALNNKIQQTNEVFALARLCNSATRGVFGKVTPHLTTELSQAGFQRDSNKSWVYQFTPNPHPAANRRSNAYKRVAIVGAGIAGSSVARALCGAGVEVTLFDSKPGPAQGASGNWAGAFHPHFSKDHALISQLTCLGCEFTQAALHSLTQEGLLEYGQDWAQPGHLQTLDSDKHTGIRQALGVLNPHPGWVSWARVGLLFNQSPAGLWFPRGGWVKPPRWVQANLAACGDLLQVQYGKPLNELPQGFDAVVVACAENTLDLASAPGYRAQQVKGQISQYRKQSNLPCVLSGQSYAIDAGGDALVLGATYERPVLDLEPTSEADQENLQRFRATHPNYPVGDWLNHRCAVRSVWPDRMPAVGKVNGVDEVFLCTGFASRGLTWAAMAAWKLVTEMGFLAGGDELRFKLIDRMNPGRYYGK